MTTCPACGLLAAACPEPCEQHTQARRIAACLHACAGLPDAALEAGDLRAALVAARDGFEATDNRAELEADLRLYAALDALGMAPDAGEHT